MSTKISIMASFVNYYHCYRSSLGDRFAMIFDAVDARFADVVHGGTRHKNSDLEPRYG